MFFPSIKKYFQNSNWLGIIAIAFLQAPAYAQQVIEDGTLPTRVNTTDNLNFTIDSINNSNRVGNNLFHSFKEFSIPTGGSAVFNNSTDVVNIINRVTGGNISNIDGLIRASGNANLFLINQLPSDVVDSSQQIASGCSVNTENSFTIVGKGGLAANPQEVVAEVNLWRDLRDLSAFNNGKKRSIQVNNDSPKKIVEATGWIVDREGNIEFVAQSSNQNNWQKVSDCKGEVENAEIL